MEIPKDQILERLRSRGDHDTAVCGRTQARRDGLGRNDVTHREDTR
jgi:hypothetical protein